MNKCMYCGADLAEAAKFCTSCGKEQVTSEPSIIATQPIESTETVEKVEPTSMVQVPPELGNIAPAMPEQVAINPAAPAIMPPSIGTTPQTAMPDQSMPNNETPVVSQPIVQNLTPTVGKLNMFYYKYLGPKGIEVENSAISITDKDSIDYSGELAPNATSEQLYFYILYAGDGKYTISFDNLEEKAIIEFNVIIKFMKF